MKGDFKTKSNLKHVNFGFHPLRPLVRAKFKTYLLYVEGKFKKRSSTHQCFYPPEEVPADSYPSGTFLNINWWIVSYDTDAFQAIASVLGLEAGEFVCVPFKR